MMNGSILVDVNRCIGCWTCSMACKTAHGLETEEFWQYVRTIGGGECDEPGGKWPKLYMKWMPIWKNSCKSCTGDKTTGLLPYCVFNCPTGALTYGDPQDGGSEFSERLETLKSRGFRVYEIPVWEETRQGIIYTEKDI